MKVSKITFIVCVIITFISCVFIVVFEDNNLLQSIFSGVFTGFIVSDVTALIGYYHERAKIYTAIDQNIKELYLNLTVISKILGKVLPQIHTAEEMPESYFHNLSELSKLNQEFFDSMNLKLFSPFCHRSVKAIICEDLKDLCQDMYSVKHNSMSLETKTLEYNKIYLTIKNSQINGIQVDQSQLMNLDIQKNLVNISAAKLHEYIACKASEIGKIAKKFYGHKNRQLIWGEIEAHLNNQAENIIGRI